MDRLLLATVLSLMLGHTCSLSVEEDGKCSLDVKLLM